MKRDLELARQLLFDIEAHGAHCSVGSLRADLADGGDERVRYNLRLLIDAQLVKEIDRSASGSPCVRLTNAGHELLELARNEPAWQEARSRAVEATGGESLTVIRAILTKWAVDAATYAPPAQYRRRPMYHRIHRPRYHGYYFDREPFAEEPRSELARARAEYRRPWRERYDWRDAYDRDVYYSRFSDYAEAPADYDDATVGVSLPVSLV